MLYSALVSFISSASLSNVVCIGFLPIVASFFDFSSISNWKWFFKANAQCKCPKEFMKFKKRSRIYGEKSNWLKFEHNEKKCETPEWTWINIEIVFFSAFPLKRRGKGKSIGIVESTILMRYGTFGKNLSEAFLAQSWGKIWTLMWVQDKALRKRHRFGIERWKKSAVWIFWFDIHKNWEDYINWLLNF